MARPVPPPAVLHDAAEPVVPGAGVRRAVGAAAALALAGHLWGLYRPTGPHPPPWFPGLDKVEHLVGFGVPTALLLVLLTWRLGRREARGWSTPTVVVAILFGLHAVVSEVVQHLFYRGRTGDVRDVLADWTGVALGVLVARAAVRRSRAVGGPR